MLEKKKKKDYLNAKFVNYLTGQKKEKKSGSTLEGFSKKI